MIDIHTHILPGIDDGSRNFDESLKILQGLAEKDVTHVILTPHYVTSSAYVSPRSANLKLLAVAPNSPKCGHGEGHRQAHRQELHRIPCQKLAVDEMVNEQHNRSAPEHQLQGL